MPFLIRISLPFYYIQMSVGLSRVKKPEHIKIVNFSPYKCPKPKSTVIEQLEPFGVPITTDVKECCHRFIPVAPDPLDEEMDSGSYPNSPNEEEISSDEDLEGKMTEMADVIEEQFFADLDVKIANAGEPEFLIFDDSVIQQVKSELSTFLGDHDILCAPLLSKSKDTCDDVLLNNNRLHDHIKYIWNSSAQIYESTVPNVKSVHPQKFQTAFDTKWESWYQNEYTKISCKLFKKWYLKVDQLIIAETIATAVKELLEEKACEVIRLEKQKSEGDTPKPPSQPPPILKESHQVIRYLGGRSLAVTRKLINKGIASRTAKSKSSPGHTMALALLQGATETYENLVKTTTDPDSLEMTERKQNICRGLTNISDDLFSVFYDIEFERRTHQNFDSLSVHRENILVYTHDKILNNVTILQKLKQCFCLPEPVYQQNQQEETEYRELYDRICKDLFQCLVMNYLRVTDNSFRKLLQDHLALDKELTHRSTVKADDLATKQQKDKNHSEGQKASLVPNSKRKTRTRTSKLPQNLNEFVLQSSFSDTVAQNEDDEEDSEFYSLCGDCQKQLIPGKQFDRQFLRCTKCNLCFHAKKCAKVKSSIQLYNLRLRNTWICKNCLMAKEKPRKPKVFHLFHQFIL